MAHFKIELLTHVTDRNKKNFNIYYLTSPITDFTVQTKDNQHFATNFSFDEKFALHANGQKDLSFSMTDKIFYNNEWIDNPYAHNIHVGSQILLTDKYGHEYLMTVSKIDFQIQELNIIYKITCQDSFSYQAINQNQGYTIENDPTSINFLGAKTLDDWGNKIINECYHTYNFLNTNEGLYLDNNNNLKTFIASDTLSDVTQIIKPIYDDSYFQQLFTFSCSGSNAVAALISLGEQLDCVIRTYERSYSNNNKKHFNKYIWFEPKRNPLPTGLRYTPNIDLQSFNFSLNGNNLATVLNITPNHLGDEIVSIFPTVPAFFQTWFKTTNWEETKFTANMFTQKLLGTTYHNNNLSVIKWNTNPSYSAIKIKDVDSLRLSESYPIINFNQNDNYSIINDTRSSSITFTLHLPYTEQGKETKYLPIEDHQEIPNWWFDIHNKETESASKIAYITKEYKEDDIDKNAEIFISMTRLRDEDERAFAEIADKCPWLESKLINLNYALSQKIISVDEYRDIYDFLNNDIRILNGRLMAYSQSYYLELHKSTKTVAKYTAMVDKIGAIVNHLVAIYAEQSSVNEEVLNQFDLEYSKMFKANLTEVEDPTFLINYNQLISSYFNKTFDANQKFFKNIKQFRDYFESYENFTASTETNALTKYSIKADYQDNKQGLVRYYSFQQTDFESIYSAEKDKPYGLKCSLWDTDLYVYRNNEYISIPLADKDISKIYKHKAAEVVSITDFTYNPELTYFLEELKYKSSIGDIPDDRYIYSQTSTNNRTTKYVELTTSEIKQLILKQSIEGSSKVKYYIRKTNIYTPLDWVRYDYSSNFEDFKALLNVNVKKIPVQEFLKDKATGTDFYKAYISSFPLDYIYYYGFKYQVKEEKKEENNQSTTFYQISQLNEFNDDFDKWNEKIKKYYEDHPDATGSNSNPSPEALKQCGQNPKQALIFQQIPFVSNIPAAITDLTNLDLDNYLENIKVVSDAFIYYSACQNQDALAVSKTNAWLSLFLGGVAGIATLITHIVYSQYAKDRNKANWLTNREPYWIFEPSIRINENNPIFSPKDPQWKVQGLYDSKEAIFGKTADAFETMEKNTLIANLADSENFAIGIDSFNKQFFNYYGLIAATYSFEYKSPLKADVSIKEAYDANGKPQAINYHLWIKNHSYSRILSKDDSIYRYDKYYLVLLDTEGKTSTKWTMFTDEKFPTFNPGWNNQFSDTKKFSNLQYYWLPKILLDLSAIDEKVWDENKDVLPITQLGYTSYNFTSDSSLKGYVFTKQVADQTWTFLLVHDEPYETQIISKDTKHTNWDEYTLDYKEWQGERLYSLNTHAPVDLLKETLPLELYTYKLHKTEDAKYLPITDDDLEVSNIIFYYKDSNGNYHRTYSIQQINEGLETTENTENAAKNAAQTQKLYPLYFRNNRHYEKQYLDKNRKKFLVNLYKHDIKYDKDGKILSHIKTPLYNQELDFTKAKEEILDKKTQWKLSFEIKNKESNIDPYTTDFILTTKTGTEFKNLSNGEIWYKFHNTSISSSLIEEANMIEVQLTQAWQAAVTASTMGNYFLPDSWKPSDNEQPNSWADQLWHIADNGSIKLSTNLLPKVFVYKTKYKDKDTEILPKYNFIYKDPNQDATNATAITTEDQFFTSNPSFQAHMSLNKYGDEGWSQWSLEENGTCTYYYLENENQGILWKRLLSDTILSSSNKRSKTLYDNFDGWYPMMYKIFRTRFSQLEHVEFLELQKEKLSKWTELYKAYPNIFLEKSYTNPNATTSKELLEMAELAFKDQLKPEEAYNLTVIDIASIKGYNGQELNIGDSIQLDTEPLYPNFDDIYNSLTKFLFITDISYDLRKDTDIQLTVNTIKYQEKLLQQLVKLIR